MDLVETMAQFGVRIDVAKVLVSMADLNEHTSIDIQEQADMKQPNVSNAVTFLKDWNYLDIRKENRHGKGRPIEYIKLAKPVWSIFKEITGYEEKLTFLQSHLMGVE